MILQRIITVVCNDEGAVGHYIVELVTDADKYFKNERIKHFQKNGLKTCEGNFHIHLKRKLTHKRSERENCIYVYTGS